jgi:hypothetical protein
MSIEETDDIDPERSTPEPTAPSTRSTAGLFALLEVQERRRKIGHPAGFAVDDFGNLRKIEAPKPRAQEHRKAVSIASLLESNPNRGSDAA